MMTVWSSQNSRFLSVASCTNLRPVEDSTQHFSSFLNECKFWVSFNIRFTYRFSQLFGQYLRVPCPVSLTGSFPWDPINLEADYSVISLGFVPSVPYPVRHRGTSCAFSISWSGKNTCLSSYPTCRKRRLTGILGYIVYSVYNQYSRFSPFSVLARAGKPILFWGTSSVCSPNRVLGISHKLGQGTWCILYLVSSMFIFRLSNPFCLIFFLAFTQCSPV